MEATKRKEEDQILSLHLTSRSVEEVGLGNKELTYNKKTQVHFLSRNQSQRRGVGLGTEEPGKRGDFWLKQCHKTKDSENKSKKKKNKKHFE